MAIEQIAALDGASLIALTVPSGARVVAIGASPDLNARLAERGCEVVGAESVEKAAADLSASGFDAVVIAGGFDQLGDPVGALQSATGLAATVVFQAANAASVRTRLAALLGDAAPVSTVPPRQYDLGALEHVVELAGLKVADRLRVFEEPVRVGDPRVPAALLEHANAAPDAHTAAFVIVATNERDADASSTPSLAESLQAQVDAATRSVLRVETEREALNARRAELEDQIHTLEDEIAALRAQTQDQQRELDVRAEALLERIDKIDRLHTERRHLELDIAVKNDYIADLRTELNTWKAAYSELKADFDDLLRSRHYRVAAGLHKVIRQIPFVHSLARGLARLAAKYARPAAAPPPAD
jgi:peptidoglycan hydrolase CwlO-like protein